MDTSIALIQRVIMKIDTIGCHIIFIDNARDNYMLNQTTNMKQTNILVN